MRIIAEISSVIALFLSVAVLSPGVGLGVAALGAVGLSLLPFVLIAVVVWKTVTPKPKMD